MSLSNERIQQLKTLCNNFRVDVINTLHTIQTGHPGGSLSVCEILTTIYFEHADVDCKNPLKEDRDRVVLCKGHAAPMLYRVLAEKGFFPVEEMKTLRQINSRLQGHPNANDTPGVDISTGPLGLGLSAAVGVALGTKLSGFDSRVYAILGDGELNEGTVWEALMSGVKFKVDNLTVFVDYNGVQLDGTSQDIMPMGDLTAKFKSFNWNVLECDGHDISSINDAIIKAKDTKGVPTIIVAKTVKGKGVSFMEGKNTWHGKAMNDEEHANAIKELGGVN